MNYFRFKFEQKILEVFNSIIQHFIWLNQPVCYCINESVNQAWRCKYITSSREEYGVTCKHKWINSIRLVVKQDQKK